MQKVMDDDDSRRDSVEEEMLAGHYSVNRGDKEGLLSNKHMTRSDTSNKASYKR